MMSSAIWAAGDDRAGVAASPWWRRWCCGVRDASFGRELIVSGSTS